MHMYYVYILYSPLFKKTYTGFTANIERRLIEHNISEVTGFTLRYRTWVLIHSEKFESKIEAMQREKFLKSGQGREQVKTFVGEYLNSSQVRYPPEAEKD